MARRNSGDKMSVRLFPELLRCSLRLDSFIHKKTQATMTSGLKNEGGAKPAPETYSGRM